MNVRLAAAVLAALALVSLGRPTLALSQDAVAVSVQRMESAAGAPLVTSRSSVSGLVTFMATSASASGAAIAVAASPQSSAETRARDFLSSHGHAFGIVDVANVAHFRSHGPDIVGTEHVRFRQLHGGIPVTAGELTVHLRGAGVVAVNAKTLDVNEKISTTPTVDADAALARAKALIAKQFGITDAAFSAPVLEVFNRGMLEGWTAPTHLAWFIEATRIDLWQFIWIDAHTGRVCSTSASSPTR